jgi:GNAT superfamily N-acetyltransferase
MDAGMAARGVHCQHRSTPVEYRPHSRISEHVGLLGVGANPRDRRPLYRELASIGIYKDDRQIGFARVVTDYATFAYLADVFVLPEFRRQGLSVWLVEVIDGHPQLQGLRRWLLATKDAHGLYRKFGFSGLKQPDRWMERFVPSPLEEPR